MSCSCWAGRAFAPLTKAERHPIDVDRVRTLAGALVDDRDMPAEQYLENEAVEILDAWVKMKKGN